MSSFFDPYVIVSLAVIIASLSLVTITIIIFLRDKISGVHVSRMGVEIHTTDQLVWNKVVDTIDQIDADTCKSIRKATTGLMIIDPETYKMSAEAMLAIHWANAPLVYATYENHHTRALLTDADAYLADKAKDISVSVQILKKHFTELSDERCNALACHWLREILLPNLRRACTNKVLYYKSQMNLSGVSKTIKEALTECLTKNEDYLRCIDILAVRPDIATKSSKFYPERENK